MESALMTDDDQLVADYLRQFRRAARRLPWGRRQELIQEITAHIADARAAARAQGPGGETVPAILDHLGDPADIVQASGGAVTAGRAGGLEIAAVILLLAGGLLFIIGWVAGCVMLWASPRWRWTDKLLGTLVWPFGLLGTAAFIGGLLFNVGSSENRCTSPGMLTGCSGAPPLWQDILIIAAVLLPQVLVVARLIRQARRVPVADSALPQPSLS
jgi:HAAS